MAFLENIIGDAAEKSSRRAFRGASRPALRSGAWPCVLLALFAFGGGLLLAFFGSDTAPETTTRIAALPAEIPYARPAAAGDLLTFASGLTPEGVLAPTLDGTIPFQNLASGRAASSMTLWSVSPVGGSEESDPSGSFAASPASDANALGAGGIFQAAAPIEVGYSAVQSPSIPEPSTVVLLACGLGVLGMRIRGVQKRRATNKALTTLALTSARSVPAAGKGRQL